MRCQREETAPTQVLQRDKNRSDRTIPEEREKIGQMSGRTEVGGRPNTQNSQEVWGIIKVGKRY